MKNNVVIIVGAGFSKWAADLPLASELFDFKITTDIDRDREKLYLRSLHELKDNWDRENPDGHAEAFVTDCLLDEYPGKVTTKRYLKINDKKHHDRIKKDLSWYVARRLADPFWRYVKPNRNVNITNILRYKRSTPSFDDPSCSIISGVIKSKSFFNSIKKNTCCGIITTNYDTLIEYSYGCNGFNYGIKGEHLKGKRQLNPKTIAGNVPILNGDIKLAKIHGSISWDEHNKYSSIKPGLSGKALIIPPTQNKSKLYSRLSNVKEVADNILSMADSAIVFGFSFNPIDNDVINLLSKAKIKCALLIDIKPPLEAAKNVWPNAIIDTMRPDDNVPKKIEEWFSKN